MADAIVPRPELPVIAGMDAYVYQSGNLIGWATDAGFDEDFMLQPVTTLGWHGPRGFKSTGYSANFHISSFLLNANEVDKMDTPTRRTILTSGLLDFHFIDKVTGKVLYEVRGAKCATNSVNLDQNLARKSTRWEATEIIPYGAV